jgi:hypothetical protein
MRRCLRVILLAAAVSAWFAGSGSSALALPSGPAPLTGSTFQGGDGDQVDQAPWIDWETLQAQHRVRHNPDPNAQDTAFAGGNQDIAPGEWQITHEADGVNPAKSNVFDAWSSVDQVGGNTFLYLAFTREQVAGTTYIAFELNRDARLWRNGRGAEIPCRRTGDLLVVFAAHASSVDAVLERWHTSASATDPDTGCATRGTFDRVATVPAGTAQGLVNQGPITSHLPGHFGPGSDIRDPALFGEAALNLGALLGGAPDDGCFAFASIWMHSRSSLEPTSQLQDYVHPQPLAVRTCSASGVKFLDSNANGERDEGEPGIPRFLIWADFDGDGLRDDNEPFTETGPHGRYVLHDIRPPRGSYELRETLLPSTGATGTSWVCSRPAEGTPPDGFANGPGGLFGCGWGPIAAATTPYATHRDFGNWLPAYLTVRKRLWPADDPGRFRLRVNGRTVVRAAGDGATRTIAVRPGSYDITETPVPPTNRADYRSSVDCHLTARQLGRGRAGTAYRGLVLGAGQHATCTFSNVHRGQPAILISKTGPAEAQAGDTLHFTFVVTNPAARPLRHVHVTDPRCDSAPELTDRAGPSGPDESPRTLDPGDAWTYACEHHTAAPTGDCVPRRVSNTGTASGTAGSTTVTDEDTIHTTLLCPGGPPQPPLPPPGPTPPGPGPHPTPPPQPPFPPGPRPPHAGTAGVAGLVVRHPCVSRVSQARIVGTRIRRIRVSVDGRRVHARTLRILQRRVAVLGRLPRPGRRGRLSVRVVFERGSDTPPVTLTRRFAVCRPAPRPHPPRFTG